MCMLRACGRPRGSVLDSSEVRACRRLLSTSVCWEHVAVCKTDRLTERAGQPVTGAGVKMTPFVQQN